MKIFYFIAYFLLIAYLPTTSAQENKNPIRKSAKNFEESYNDNLIIIQAISTTGKSFAIRKGREDGIFVGQEAIFSNENISLAARVIEATRNFSLWAPSDKNATVPFIKQQFVIYSNSLENIYTEIPQLRAKEKIIHYILESSFYLRSGYSYSINETVSETSAERQTTRNGINVDLIYRKQFTRKFGWGIGARYETDGVQQKDPDLTIISTRLYGLAEVHYFFDRWKGTKNNFFASFTLGFGSSQTSIDDTVSTGLAMILPSIHLGLQIPIGGTKIVPAIAIENISTRENFAEESTQSTQIMNIKISLGIIF